MGYEVIVIRIIAGAVSKWRISFSHRSLLRMLYIFRPFETQVIKMRFDDKAHELPRSKLLGIESEHCQLLLMQFFISSFTILFLNILYNGLLVAKLANSICEISTRPKLTTP